MVVLRHSEDAPENNIPGGGTEHQQPTLYSWCVWWLSNCFTSTLQRQRCVHVPRWFLLGFWINISLLMITFKSDILHNLDIDDVNGWDSGSCGDGKWQREMHRCMKTTMSSIFQPCDFVRPFCPAFSWYCYFVVVHSVPLNTASL